MLPGEVIVEALVAQELIALQSDGFLASEAAGTAEEALTLLGPEV